MNSHKATIRRVVNGIHTPKKSECLGDQKVGDDSGCTYRLLETVKAINASCLYELFDSEIESYNPTCFASCPQPHNTTSDCYLHCYSKTMAASTQEQLVAPWSKAFDGGCPLVHLPGKLADVNEKVGQLYFHKNK